MVELTTEFLVTLLIFVLTFSMSFIILKKIFKDRISGAIVSLSVALISSWYLTKEQIQMVSQINGISQIIFLGAFPLVIFASFVYLFLDISGIIRKILWIFYGGLNIYFLKNSGLAQEAITNWIIGIILTILIIVVFDVQIKNLINIRKNLKKAG
jgi:hypothetical protein